MWARARGCCLGDRRGGDGYRGSHGKAHPNPIPRSNVRASSDLSLLSVAVGRQRCACTAMGDAAAGIGSAPVCAVECAFGPGRRLPCSQRLQH